MEGASKRQKVEASPSLPDEGGGGGADASSPHCFSRAAATKATTTSTTTPCKDTPPPLLNLDDSALEVFTQPFFKPLPTMESERRILLDQLSIQQAFEKFFKSKTLSSVGAALETLAHRAGIDEERVGDYYYAGADLPARKVLAATFLRARYGCDFAECVVGVGTALDPLVSPPRRTDGGEGGGGAAGNSVPDRPEAEPTRTIDVTFLDPLRRSESKERFLIPRTVYVRDCMRTLFGLMMEDVAPKKKEAGAMSTALIGSPGVGKSILFFLAALAQAEHRQPVMYYRRTASDLEMASVFYMTPEEGKVRIWFTRNINEDLLRGGLTDFNTDLQQALLLHRDDYYIYIDGPKESSTSDLMSGKYDYFCTSGGFSYYKDEEARKRLWILDGWTQDEAVEGLVALGFTEEKAEDAYRLCGGRIRKMLAACESREGRGDVVSTLNEMVRKIGEDVVQLAVLSTDHVGTEKNPDWLRTMFEARQTDPATGDAWKRRMTACQRVDSPYVMDKLMSKLGSGPFFESYILARDGDSGAAEGIFFECLFHQRVRALYADPLPPIDNLCWSTGTAVQGLEELDRPNLYWKPSTSNFKAVDAALVHNGTLYVFQLTISSFKPKFSGPGLARQFVAVVRKVVPFQRTVVTFVSPSGTNYNVKGHKETPSFMYRAEEVDMTNLDSIDRSIVRIFDSLE